MEALGPQLSTPMPSFLFGLTHCMGFDRVFFVLGPPSPTPHCLVGVNPRCRYGLFCIGSASVMEALGPLLSTPVRAKCKKRNRSHTQTHDITEPYISGYMGNIDYSQHMCFLCLGYGGTWSSPIDARARLWRAAPRAARPGISSHMGSSDCSQHVCVRLWVVGLFLSCVSACDRFSFDRQHMGLLWVGNGGTGPTTLHARARLRRAVPRAARKRTSEYMCGIDCSVTSG